MVMLAERETLSVAELRGFYMADEIRPEMLRAMIDQLRLDLNRQELVHRTDTSETNVLIREKHLGAGIALNEVRTRLGRAETALAIIYGDPDRKSDVGKLGSHSEQLKRLWEAHTTGKDERWKLRVAILAVAFTGGSLGALSLKLLGVM